MHNRIPLPGGARALTCAIASYTRPHGARFVLVLALVVMYAPSTRMGAQGRGAPAHDRGAAFVESQLIVKYRSGATAGETTRARGRAAAVAMERLSRSAAARAAGDTELLKLPPGRTIAAALAALQADPAVEYAEPNWIYTHAVTVPCAGNCTSDPRFSDQWALNNTGQPVAGATGGKPNADIDAPEAWSRTLGSASVYVGVIDEGIDINHEDLGTQPNGPIWTNPFEISDGIDNDGNGYIDDIHGWDFFANDNTVYDGSAADPSMDSHGTHVAGTIAARVDNGIGVAGVNWAVTVIPAKFLGPGGGTTAGAIRAVDYLTDLKVRHNLNIVAINNSWTGGGFSQGLLDAITRAAKQDILFIAAAGNGGADFQGDDNDALPQYPSNYDTTAGAGYDSVISVAGTGRSDEVATWSNLGATTVHLGAPGAGILSTAPQNGYAFLSGTSMATPHVTGAAALVNAARALTGAALREAILSSVDRIPSLQGRTVTGGRLNVRAAVDPPSPPPPPPAGVDEIVLYAMDAARSGSAWTVVGDASAAGGSRLQNPDAGAAKIATALAAPASYAELTFQADAGKAYRLWLRGKGEKDAWANDSVYVQFSDSVSASGAPALRIRTSDAAWVSVEDCSGCGLSGWGWQDNGYGAGVLGPAIYFAAGGTHTLRLQTREDGIGIDQVVLSAVKYITAPPGTQKNDTTFLTAVGGTPDTSPTSPPPAPAKGEILLYAADAPIVAGNWQRIADATAAGGARLQNANRAATKITTALASPVDYFEMTFEADAGKPYRLWLRGKAEGNSWANDSVHVQFDGSVTAAGAAAYRIGTATSTEVNLEDCANCGVAAWGWQDNGYGAGTLGPVVYFAVTGTQRIRIQVRDDGLGIDQIVLSADKYLTTAPGALKNDSTILR